MTSSTTRAFAPLPGERDGTEGEAVFLTGIQALVRVVLDAMRRDRSAGLHSAAFVSGYPGSPLGGFDKELARHRELLAQLNVVHLPGQNEELAATAVAGSQLAQGFRSARFDGVLGVWYGKAPGLDRALDALWHGQFTGASSRGGVLLFVGDDPACKSSMVPSASEHTLASLHIPVLFPGTVEEILSLGAHGVALSRASGLWTSLKIVASVADGFGAASASALHGFEGAPVHGAGAYVPTIRPPCVPDSLQTEQEIATLRSDAAVEYGRLAGLNRVTRDTDDAWIGIVAAGSVYREVLAALEGLGLDHDALRRYGVRLMQVQMLHPLEPLTFRHFGRGLREILVVEEKRSLLEPYLREALYGSADPPMIVGRFDELGKPLVPGFGVVNATDLTAIIAARLRQKVPEAALARERADRPRIPVASVRRTPFFCSGCPHNSSLRVPEGSLVGVGTGCHALSAWADERMVGNIVTKAQMGGEGATWLGLQPFVADDHMFQDMGDGTYFHSGQLAIQAAVAAGSHITFKLLYNGAIAMTGGQDPAESNSRPVQDVAEVLLRQGVSRVLITTDDPASYRGVRLPRGVEVWHRRRVLQAQVELAKVPGVTVMIHDQRCAAEKRRDRTRGKLPSPSRRVVINERVCEGCGDCGVASNCLSVEPVETELGRKTTINQTSCNADYSCLEGNCPSFLTVRPRSKSFMATIFGRSRSSDPTEPALPKGRGQAGPEPGTLEDPRVLLDPEDVTIRMPGIGGTGVVTVSQIIGMAATHAGRHVQGLDQTGLSQKAGAVVSDVRLSVRPLQGSNQLTRAADLYLGFDEVVALLPSNLESVARGRSIAVLSISPVPTAEMITHTDRTLPSRDHVEAVLSALVGPERVFLVDAIGLSERLLGSATFANVLLLGVAFQVGAVPLPAASIERAIELNGVAVRQNLAAFRWGRAWVCDRTRLMALIDQEGDTDAVSQHDSSLVLPRAIRQVPELSDLVELRARDLEAYQSRSYSEHYLEVVELALRAEERAVGRPLTFSSSVARSLHKLMAYKDEYEVARLHLLSLPAEARNPGVRASWHLEPPILKSIGLDRKIEVGPWFRYAFLVLRAARSLRGTMLDPFGRTEVRRTERRLVAEYEADVRRLSELLTAETYGTACQLAQLPDVIRGYDEVKMRNVAEYDMRRRRLLSELGIASDSS